MSLACSSEQPQESVVGDATCGAATLLAHGQPAESGLAMSGTVTPHC